MHWRYVFKHPLININDFYVRLRLRKNKLISGFDTPPPTFLMEVVSKKSSKLVKFKNLFKPNVPPPSFFWRRCQKKFK